jgi:hypothetical protein
MIAALPHLHRRVLKRKNALFQCRLFKHSFSWTLVRFSGVILRGHPKRNVVDYAAQKPD